LAVAADGSLYLTGDHYGLQATPGAFQQQEGSLPQVILRIDSELQNILAATYFNAEIKSLVLDKQGNIYAGGSTGAALSTRTPMYIGFGAGFLSELSGDLSTLLFSSYYGADQNFNVQGVAVGLNGSILIGGFFGRRTDQGNFRRQSPNAP
jgi:hypothetical protein